MRKDLPTDDAGVLHFTLSERFARGRAARAGASRRSHAALDLPANRDPIVWLETQAATRVAELVPIRYSRMLTSPLAFFRGAATVMANDLAAALRTDLNVQLCGDAHLLNFGGFSSPERDLVFDLNDFDETLPGPFEWDVKRLAASVEIAARERKLPNRDRSAAVRGAVRTYRETMRELAEMSTLDVWHAHVDARELVTELRNEHERRVSRTVERTAARARMNDSAHALAKLTRLVDGEPRIVSEPPVIVPIDELTRDSSRLEAQLRTIFRSYRRSLPRDRRALLDRFRYGDLALKVVGIGSVGTRCWLLLLIGRDEHDPLFLQLKEAQASVLDPHLSRSGFRNQGQRVVEGQRLAQVVSDIFLGWTRVEELDGAPRDFYVRQLRDWKVSIDLERIGPRGLRIYARWCGATLARAHGRSGDSVAIAAYLGKSDRFDRAMADFAASYADVNERDHASLRAAVDDGRLAVPEGL
ncbi:MAG: DUF2252 domain-containing protein [Actinomycetota bacterium]|nr:DUF2252 domain-containing protein [Actinomycetota bacterium]